MTSVYTQESSIIIETTAAIYSTGVRNIIYIYIYNINTIGEEWMYSIYLSVCVYLSLQGFIYYSRSTRVSRVYTPRNNNSSIINFLIIYNNSISIIYVRGQWTVGIYYYYIYIYLGILVAIILLLFRLPKSK